MRAVWWPAPACALSERHHLQGPGLLPERLARQHVEHQVGIRYRLRVRQERGDRGREELWAYDDVGWRIIGLNDRAERWELELGRLGLARAAPPAEAGVRGEGEPALAAALYADMADGARDLAGGCLPE